jgi:hypothetical protein
MPLWYADSSSESDFLLSRHNVSGSMLCDNPQAYLLSSRDKYQRLRPCNHIEGRQIRSPIRVHLLDLLFVDFLCVSQNTRW